MIARSLHWTNPLPSRKTVSAWNSERLGNSELANILLRAVKGEHMAKRTEKCKVLSISIYWIKRWKKMEDHICPKVQVVVDEEMWICSSHPFKHKTTLNCAERKAKLFGKWIMRLLLM